MNKTMVAAIRYHTKFGTDTLVVRLKDTTLPKLTNDLLDSLGVLEPDLDGDETAEWVGPFLLQDLPEV